MKTKVKFTEITEPPRPWPTVMGSSWRSWRQYRGNLLYLYHYGREEVRVQTKAESEGKSCAPVRPYLSRISIVHAIALEVKRAVHQL